MLEHVVGNVLNGVLWLVLHELAQGFQKKGHDLCLKVGSHGQLALKRREGLVFFKLVHFQYTYILHTGGNLRVGGFSV